MTEPKVVIVVPVAASPRWGDVHSEVRATIVKELRQQGAQYRLLARGAASPLVALVRGLKHRREWEAQLKAAERYEAKSIALETAADLLEGKGQCSDQSSKREAGRSK